MNPKIDFKACSFTTNCLSWKLNAYFLPVPTILVLISGYIAFAHSLFSTWISQEMLELAVVTILTLKYPCLNITEVYFSVTHMYCWIGGMRLTPQVTDSLSVTEAPPPGNSEVPHKREKNKTTRNKLWCE